MHSNILFLQPDISKFSAELLPVLFDYLTQATQHIEKDPRGVTKTYYALEMFVENLGELLCFCLFSNLCLLGLL